MVGDASRKSGAKAVIRPDGVRAPYQRRPKGRTRQRRKVLKMLAHAMGDKTADPQPLEETPSEQRNQEDFQNSGRTGRRNALPDILGENAHTTVSDLPSRLQGLSTSEEQPQPQQPQASTADKQC